ncbi:MAG: hypothetical protein KTR15_14975 [Phycisphaeraceae bacterium]|nr:hypothetical protein [Phycisphaeraceae bacterium]
MMPLHERLDFGFQTTVTVLSFYLLGCVLLVIGILLYDLLLTTRSSPDSAGLMVFLILATVFVLPYGFFIGVGAWISALLFPAVARSQLYWFAPAGTGLLSSAGLYLLTLETTFDPFEIEEFGLILLLSGIGVFFSRIIGLTFGWARHWYPPGACDYCGYDLRETQPGGTCPECGEVAEKPFLRRS